MKIVGAGGTKGGSGRFVIGLVMMVAGGYLFLTSVRVTHHFHMGYGIFNVGGFNVTTGMVLVPFIFGIGFVFYNAKNIIGWALTLSSLTMLLFGVITSLQFRMRSMNAFELIGILILLIGGIGLFLSSLKTFD